MAAEQSTTTIIADEDPEREEYERQWHANLAPPQPRRVMREASMWARYTEAHAKTADKEGVGAAAVGPCTFVGTCTNCLRFRICAGVVVGGPCGPQEELAITTMTEEGDNTTDNRSAVEHEAA